ncbi:MAG: hypothetical protein IH624_02530 [Phycisphaerae bacterium]|nr:hypothetical protein [Phycisphaerae bacterium]
MNTETPDAADDSSQQHFWITLIIVGVALGGMIGVVGGALVTRPTRNRTAAEIADIRAAADADVQEATRIAKEAAKSASLVDKLQAEIKRLKEENAEALTGKMEAERKLAGPAETSVGRPAAAGSAVSRDLSEVLGDTHALKTPFFDIYLGESINVLGRRSAIRPSAFSYKDKDHPGAIHDVLAVPAGVRSLRVSTVGDHIYGVEVDFLDTSKTNLDALTKQLEAKYGHRTTGNLSGSIFGETAFSPRVDGEIVWITINRDVGIGEPDTLRLVYHHSTLTRAVQTEIERRKAPRVSDKL